MELKLHGFPQIRRAGAVYFIRRDVTISLDDISALKNEDGKFEPEWDSFVFKPDYQDVVQVMGPNLNQIQQLAGGGWVAYSPFGQEGSIKALGATMLEAMMNLFIEIEKKLPRRVIEPSVLDESENKVIGEEK